MNNTAAALSLIARASGTGPDMDVQRNRLRLQRVIYLAQQRGMPRMYVFRWNTECGPYSDRLAADIALMRYESEEDPNANGRRLTDGARRAVRQATRQLAPPDDPSVPASDHERVTATAAFLRDIGYVSASGRFLRPPERLRMTERQMDMLRSALMTKRRA